MKMYPMQQKVWDEFQYCVTCEKMVHIRSISGETFHWLDLSRYIICDGPFTSCPPPEEGGFLLASDADFEQEEPEPTYEDVHNAQIIDEFLTHYIPN